MNTPQRERSAGRWIALGLGVLAGAYLAFLVLISLAGGAERIGYAVGLVGGALLISLAVRWAFLRLRPADRRPGYWSPWILVMAAVLVLLAGVGARQAP